MLEEMQFQSAALDFGALKLRTHRAVYLVIDRHLHPFPKSLVEIRDMILGA
jgi:hypothetical protein